jgi:RNAse (barnase) inhibitor barstar
MKTHVELLKNSLLHAQVILSKAAIDELAEAGIMVFYIPGEQITNKETFLQAARQAMAFPDYFGANWDAFEECLRDLSWMPAKEYILAYDHPECFAQADPAQFNMALSILRDAEKFWQEQGPPLYLVLAEGKTLFEN